MTDLTGKTWMAIGETDDFNAIIETCDAVEAAVTKGAPVCLSSDQSLSYSSRTELYRRSSEKCHCKTLPSPKSELNLQFR